MLLPPLLLLLPLLHPSLQESTQTASAINNPGLFYLVAASSTFPLASKALSAHKNLNSTPRPPKKKKIKNIHSRKHPAEL